MKKKILFICINNSARSQIAEGFMKSFFSNKYDSYSAGIKPTKINPYAIEVMNEIGIDISQQYSKKIDEFKNIRFNIVITVCDNAMETCPYIPGEKVIHKNFIDPVKINGNKNEKLEFFRKTRDEIKKWIVDKFDE
jgi:arsenate reductase